MRQILFKTQALACHQFGPCHRLQIVGQFSKSLQQSEFLLYCHNHMPVKITKYGDQNGKRHF